MSRIVSRAEAWERAYEVFQQVNFSAFDYTTIKESMIEYIKLYFPEDFNDYIESSEFIAILELFAYAAELLAYRLDLNAHENFITTAQRKESVLRLAKLISYKASRNIPARGIAKIQSIQTTEAITDSSGLNLANVRIRWNDRNNPNWKDQFILVINRLMQQPFGSVSPNDRVQVEDVVFELYDFDNIPTTSGVLSFQATVSGRPISMEVVPQELTEFGPTERHPERSQPMSVTYASDGLGDGSDTTGFMFFVKQGTLNRQVSSFDGVTPNQTFALANVGINETDVWINNVDSDTGETISKWEEVDIAASQNIIFNTTESRTKYELETLDDDGVRVIFGDGEFANIPSGTFDFWHRTSLTDPVVIPQNSIQGQVATFTYNDVNGNVQTATFTFSLINTLQNAAGSETIDHIRRTAPSVYYTQDRMVNARDYNTFLLQDPTIAKLRAVNRTFAGDSKYIPWHDPSETYENVKIFGNDLLLYYNSNDAAITANESTSVDIVIDSLIEPILSTADFSNILNSEGVEYYDVRREFTTAERTAIETALSADPIGPFTYHLFYSIVDDAWQIRLGEDVSGENLVLTNPPTITDPLWTPLKDSNYVRGGSPLTTIGSPTTSLWTEIGSPPARPSYPVGYIVSLGSPFAYYESLVASGSPNIRPPGSPQQWSQYAVEGIIKVEFDSSSGWTVTWKSQRLVAESQTTRFWDTNDGNQIVTFDALNNKQDRIVVLQANINPGYDTLNSCGIVGSPGVILPGNVNFVILQQENTSVGLPDINRLSVIPEDDNTDAVPDFCKTINNATFSVNDLIAPDRATALTTPYNFAWFHYTPDRNLVDPASSNIIDIFLITRGYIENLKNWINGVSNVQPAAPTPLQLRSDYGELLENKMISDTVVLRSGVVRLLFGAKAETELRAQFKVIKNPLTNLTDNQIKTRIVDVIRQFFNIDLWEFGETFYYTELAAAIHQSLGSDIDSVVLVPTLATNQFGDLFQVEAREDEVFQPDIDVNDIVIVTSLTSTVLQQDPA